MSTGNDGLAAKVRGLDQRVSALEDVLASHIPTASGGDVWRERNVAARAAEAEKNAAAVAAAEAIAKAGAEAGAKADAERAKADAEAAEKAAKQRAADAKAKEKAVKEAEAKAAAAIAEAEKAGAIARVIEGSATAASAAAADAAQEVKKAKAGRANIGLLCAFVVAAGVLISNARVITDWTTGLSNGGTANVGTDDAGTATLTVDAATITTLTPTTVNATTLTVSGDITAGSVATDTLEDDSVPTAVAVTNGGSYTLSGLVLPLDSSGSATTATNTITLLTLGDAEAGRIFYVINVGSNNIKVATSGTWKSPQLDLDENEGVTIVAQETNSFYAASTPQP